MKQVMIAGLFLLLNSSTLSALDLSLSIQPVLPKADILHAYQPLADYLTKQTGHNISIKAHSNFLTYWSSLRQKKGFDLTLDAAHFTDYRVNKLKYTVLAKLPDTVSFTLVTHEDNLVLDAEELILKKIATMVSPSVGAIRLLSLFPDPMRQPRFIYALDSLDAVQQVISGEAFAAIIPTGLVANFEKLNSVLTTDSLPHMAFSASPEIPVDVAEKIQLALLSAKNTPEGKAMLEKLNFVSFERSSNKDYAGYKSLLQDTLGY